MKQIASILLGLSLVVGAVAAAGPAPAQNQPKTEKKQSKGKTTKKTGKKKAEQPKAQ